MNILIIYAHPYCKSFNHAILEQVESSIPSIHKVKTIDLYRENFDPDVICQKILRLQSIVI